MSHDDALQPLGEAIELLGLASEALRALYGKHAGSALVSRIENFIAANGRGGKTLTGMFAGSERLRGFAEASPLTAEGIESAAKCVREWKRDEEDIFGL